MELLSGGVQLIVVEGRFASNSLRGWMREHLLLQIQFSGQKSHFLLGDRERVLHEVLRILIPHCVSPLALNGGVIFGEVALGIRFERLASKLLIHLLEPLDNVGGAGRPQGLVFDVAVNVGGRHVGVVVSAHVHFQGHMLVLFHKIHHFV